MNDKSRASSNVFEKDADEKARNERDRDGAI
jgi:hypothetical protein